MGYPSLRWRWQYDGRDHRHSLCSIQQEQARDEQQQDDNASQQNGINHVKQSYTHQRVFQMHQVADGRVMVSAMAMAQPAVQMSG